VDMDISIYMDIHGYIHGYPRKICGYGYDEKFYIHGKPGCFVDGNTIFFQTNDAGRVLICKFSNESALGFW